MKFTTVILSFFISAAAFGQSAPSTQAPQNAAGAGASIQNGESAGAVQASAQSQSVQTGQAGAQSASPVQVPDSGASVPPPSAAGGFPPDSRQSMGGFSGQRPPMPPQFGGSRRDFGRDGRSFDRGERFSNPMSGINETGDMQGPFYFVDESPLQILQALEILQKKTILIAQGIPNIKINFVSKRKMTREDAISALTALLSLNGVAILPLDEKFMRAVPVIGVNRQAPQFIYGDIDKLPPSQTFYTRLFELEYMEAQFFLSKIRSFLSMEGVSVIEYFQRSNAVLITDTLVNLQKADKILKELDKPAKLREDVAFIQIKNVGAADLRERLVKMQNEMLKKYFEATTLDVDTRTNQLIVVTNKGNLDIIKKFIEGLDVVSEPILKNEVYKIRHCKPAEVTQVLNSIIQQQRQQVQRMTQAKSSNAATIAASAASAAARAASSNRGRSGQSQRVNLNLSGLSGLTSGDGTTGLEFSDYVQVVAHEKSSSVVAYGTPSDLKQLGDIIRKLDVAVEQVKIDVIITEVNLTDSQVSGLSTFGISYNYPTAADGGGNPNPFGEANAVDVTTSTGSLPDSSTKAFSLNLGKSGFDAVFNTASENQNVKVLSAPTIVTTHSVEAEITVSEEYPIITATTTGITSDTATKSQVEYKDIGITLIVTPYVGTDGKIQMEIRQNVDSIARYTTIDANEQPVVSKRYAKSTVYAENGEVIVLGGLQQTDASDTEGSVWLLGDLPLIGSLFNPATTQTKRRELIIFIRPTVIQSLDSETTISKYVAGSHIEREVSNYLRKGDFYTDKEINANFEEFEKNRFYNKLFTAPWTLITGEKRTVDGSTRYVLKNADSGENDADKSPDSKAENSVENGRGLENIEASTPVLPRSMEPVDSASSAQAPAPEISIEIESVNEAEPPEGAAVKPAATSENSAAEAEEANAEGASHAATDNSGGDSKSAEASESEKSKSENSGGGEK